MVEKRNFTTFAVDMLQRLLHVLICISAVTVSWLFAGCSSSSGDDEPPVAPVDTVDEPEGLMVLVYMVACNDLGQRGFDSDDIGEMSLGMQQLSSDAVPARLLVYHHPYNGTPALKEVTRDGEVATLKTYDAEEPSVSIARMRRVLADADALAGMPHMGLVLWSHGTGWLEESSAYDDPDARPLSFGYQQGSGRMKVPSLAQALEGYAFDFIYFDCCLMGTVEVAYELRNSAQSITAICTELPLEGMPYDRNIPEFFSGKSNADVAAARKTYDYYCSDEASQNSIAIGVYDTSKLDALASATRDVMATGALPAASYQGVPYFRKTVVATGAYDMGDYIGSLSIAPELSTLWNDAYNAVVKYCAATPRSYGLDMSRFTGMGCVMFSNVVDRRLSYGYRNLAWWRDVVSHHPLFIQ